MLRLDARITILILQETFALEIVVFSALWQHDKKEIENMSSPFVLKDLAHSKSSLQNFNWENQRAKIKMCAFVQE